MIKDSNAEFDASLYRFSITVSSSFTDACRDWRKICFWKEDPQLLFGGRGSNVLRLCRQNLFVLHWPLTTPKKERKPHAIFLLTQLQIKETLYACNEESFYLGTFWTKQGMKKEKKTNKRVRRSYEKHSLWESLNTLNHVRESLLLPPFDVEFC